MACIAGAAASGCLGLLAAHRGRPLSDPRPTSARWWKLTASGAGLLAALIIVTTATGELPEAGWFIAMITGLTALVLIGAGLVLGIAHLASRPSRRATAH
jgi:peptidoglycan/LPS O-acetylase OafA/YrhL